MKLDRSQKIFCIFCLLLMVYLLLLPKAPYQEDQVTEEYLSSLDLKNVDRIMIVAHPDDESLWGGAHLARNNYLVVCLTNGKTYNYRRYWEFKTAMEVTNTPNIILNYPDFQNGKRIDWKPYEKQIEKDISKLLNYKKWKVVVTHNPYGEYGHQHHIGTSNIVTRSAQKYGYFNKLYYFGLYYRDAATLPTMKKEPKQSMDLKRKMFLPYHRERNTIKKHQLMHPYEQWIKASNWSTYTKNNSL